MQNIGIFYGSSTGNTESVAKKIQEEFGADIASIIDVADASVADLEKFDNLILGTSTWGIGDLQDDFEGFLSEISNANMDGKKVALFGLGDQYSYSDSFVDGMGELFKVLEEKNCELIGETSTDGYEYDASGAEKDGKFVGLPIDIDNQDDQTEERVADWVAELKNQFN
jgi:flavodoxin, long chain